MFIGADKRNNTFNNGISHKSTASNAAPYQKMASLKGLSGKRS
jgi:hypothetical protein